MQDQLLYKTQWTIRKYLNDDAFRCNQPYAEHRIAGNLLLNEGITALQNLLTGAAETAFDNTNAYIGVGDDNTAESASQTGLLGTNKVYLGMKSGYPSLAGQTTTWRAVADGATANFDWNEFTVANGNSDAADNLNRKVSAQGTKTSGQTWTVDLEITWS